MTTTTVNPADTMHVISVVGLHVNRYRVEWRMEALDCNGGAWLVEFSSGGDTAIDSASAFAESIRTTLGGMTYREDFSGTPVECFLSDRDVHKVSHMGYTIRLDALTFTPLADPA